MKKVKYILIILLLVILSTSFYENFIFYRIAYNPFAKLDPDSLVGFHFTENHPDNDITKISVAIIETFELFG